MTFLITLICFMDSLLVYVLTFQKILKFEYLVNYLYFQKSGHNVVIALEVKVKISRLWNFFKLNKIFRNLYVSGGMII